MLIVSSDCPACVKLKEKLEKGGKLGKVRIIDASSKDGKALVEGLGIDSVPECVVVEEDEIRVCTDEELEELVNE